MRAFPLAFLAFALTAFAPAHAMEAPRGIRGPYLMTDYPPTAALSASEETRGSRRVT